MRAWAGEDYDPAAFDARAVRHALILADAWGALAPAPPTVVGRTSTMPPRFTELQGQYLAFIDSYSRVNGRSPAEADVARYFGVAPPSVHEMLVRLEKAGLIARATGRVRSIRVLVPEDGIPRLGGPSAATG